MDDRLRRPRSRRLSEIKTPLALPSAQSHGHGVWSRGTAEACRLRGAARDHGGERRDLVRSPSRRGSRRRAARALREPRSSGCPRGRHAGGGIKNLEPRRPRLRRGDPARGRDASPLADRRRRARADDQSARLCGLNRGLDARRSLATAARRFASPPPRPRAGICRRDAGAFLRAGGGDVSRLDRLPRHGLRRSTSGLRGGGARAVRRPRVRSARLRPHQHRLPDAPARGGTAPVAAGVWDARLHGLDGCRPAASCPRRGKKRALHRGR